MWYRFMKNSAESCGEKNCVFDKKLFFSRKKEFAMLSDMAMTVSQLVGALRRAVEIDVGEQTVEGEIGSCKWASSGHVYFTIKDALAQIDCVMYRSQAAGCASVLREGVKAELKGKATVYEGRGRLQFLVTKVREAGAGELQTLFEDLKRKLAAEGLFDASRKRKIPSYAQAVGLITSPTGAVIQDMRHVFERRAPWIHVYLLPVRVQGSGAEYGIAEAVRVWNFPAEYCLPKVDYLIVARGGGSLEDLWCFNEEILVRAIAESEIPVISAVGHETDFTIADFVADLRAPTPTAAVELGTPDGAALGEKLFETALYLKRRLTQACDYARVRLQLAWRGMEKSSEELLQPWWQQLDEVTEDMRDILFETIEDGYQTLERLELQLTSKHPRESGKLMRNHLENLKTALQETLKHRIQNHRTSLDMLENIIRAVGPEETLKRGYSLVSNAQGKLLRCVSDADVGDEVNMRFADGVFDAQIIRKKPQKK